MKPHFALALWPLVGCAAIIGASFDDAGLAPVDAAIDTPKLFPDVIQQPDVVEASVPFVPSSLPNLWLWLDATQQVDTKSDAGAGPVTRWHDRSGNGHDAVALATSNGVNAPSLVPGALGGLPVVRFASAQLDLLAAPAGPISNELTLFLVSRGYPNSAVRFQTASGQFPFILFPVDGLSNPAAPNFLFDVGTPATDNIYARMLFDGGASVATGRWHSNGTIEAFVAGALDEQRLSSLALPNAMTLFIGGALPLLGTPNEALPFCNGDIAEILVYGSALDDVDRVTVEHYVETKWSL